MITPTPDQDARDGAKADYLEIASSLMPQGKPNFSSLIVYPMVRDLVAANGKKNIRKTLFLIIKSFCASLNVVRNMNEDQMIEASQMLIDECGNFRLEDYVMMFQMAKRDGLKPLKIMDRVDVQLISQMLDIYWEKRNKAGKEAEEAEISATDRVSYDNPTDRLNLVWNGKEGYVKEKTAYDKGASLASSLEILKHAMEKNGMKNLDEEAAKKQIIANPNYKNPHTPKDSK